MRDYTTEGEGRKITVTANNHKTKAYRKHVRDSEAEDADTIGVIEDWLKEYVVRMVDADTGEAIDFDDLYTDETVCVYRDYMLNFISSLRATTA